MYRITLRKNIACASGCKVVVRGCWGFGVGSRFGGLGSWGWSKFPWGQNGNGDKTYGIINSTAGAGLQWLLRKHATINCECLPMFLKQPHGIPERKKALLVAVYFIVA